MSKILLIEDDEELAAILVPALHASNHAVDHAGTADLGRAFLDNYAYDVVILDWELPDGAGVELCRQFRADGGRTPILMFPARSLISDKTAALDSGSDDYLTRPYEVDELVARIGALLRRTPTSMATASAVQYADMALHIDAREIFVNKQRLQVSPIEYELLSFLISHRQVMFDFEALRVRVWQSQDISKNAIAAVVAKLRKKMSECGAVTSITTVGREGYKLEGPQ